MKASSWPESDLVPSGAMAMDTLEKRAARDTVRASELVARPLWPLSTGTPPKARDSQEKNGIRNSSFLPNANCLTGQTADIKNPSDTFHFQGHFLWCI